MTQPNNREIYTTENQVARENNAASSGIVLGILLATAAAIGVGAFFFTNQTSENPSPNQTTIIEKTKEVPVSQPPDVNVKVPDVNVKAPDVKIENSNPSPVETPNTQNNTSASPSASSEAEK